MGATRPSMKVTSDSLKEQLIKETKENFKLDIDQSKIQIKESQNKGNDGTIVSVPLVDAVKATSDDLKQGGIDVGAYCMATEKLNGCFKAKLTDINEKEASLTLVDKEGKTVATTTASVNHHRQQSVSCINVYIDGVYLGCFDVVIIIIWKSY